MTFIGIDLGTSALKAVLVDERQIILADCTVPLRTSTPRPGWSEQNPEDWWTALCIATTRLRAADPAAFGALRAIGLSGQMHAAVLTDQAGQAIRPAILWNDSRATAECELLHAAVPDLHGIAGVPAMPGVTAPKLLWVRRHEPDAFRRIWKVLSAKDFLRLRLTGIAATDMSDAASTLWLDQGARDWSEPMLAATGLSRAELPELYEGPSPTGLVLQSVLAGWGNNTPVIVAAGAGDAAAGAVGIGAVHAGDAFISLGTSAQFFLTEDTYQPQRGTSIHSFAHALPGRWSRIAALLNGASCLDWVSRIVGSHDVGSLLERAAAEFRGPSGVLFLPYLTGERTPHNDPAARGVYFGLDPGTTPTDLVQATLEGVVFSLMDAQDCLQNAGASFGDVAVVGGGARSRFWMQLLAHGLGRKVVRFAGSEQGPAFGAARLARLALTSESPDEVCTRPDVLDVLEPDGAQHSAYCEQSERFRELYVALKSAFRSGLAFRR